MKFTDGKGWFIWEKDSSQNHASSVSYFLEFENEKMLNSDVVETITVNDLRFIMQPVHLIV